MGMPGSGRNAPENDDAFGIHYTQTKRKCHRGDGIFFSPELNNFF
jgi:hypothetical protein